MSCPVCLNPATTPSLVGRDVLFETTPETFALHACKVCHCLFLHPMPEPERIATFYPKQYWWSSERQGVLKKAESIYRRLVLLDHIWFINGAAARFGRPASEIHILDVGCGSGTLLGLLKKRGFRVTGVDFSHEAAQIAKKENGVNVVVGSLERVQFPDCTFDLVTMFHVMEHVTNPRAVLAEVSRILKSDGRAVIQVPNIGSLQFKLFGSRWYGLDVPRHLIDYSQESILKLLTTSGFSADRVRHFSLRDNAPALASSLFPQLDPVSRSVRKQNRNVRESTLGAWGRHLAYAFLVLCAHPITVTESALGRGATVMIEARRVIAAQ